MSTTPLLYKENDGLTTPQQPRRLPPPHSTGAIGGGRSFGTPLSNCHSAAANNTNSNGASKSAAKSSKKLVRARKLLQTHRSTPLPPPQLPKQYTVTFLPGPIGMQLEPANDIFGCRVSAIVDGGPEEPGQARKSQEIQEGDILVELNDEPIFHREYDDIIDSLRELSNKPRKVVFRNTPVVPANESSPAPTVQPSPAINTPKVTNHTNSVSFTYEPFSTPVVSPPQASVETPNTESNSETVLPGPSPGDVVLDMKNTSDSIDSSPAITPSKVKNLSQEDLELGLGQLRGTNADNDTNETATQDSKPPLSNVLRNVYQNVVIGKVGSFDFGKLGEALTGGHVSSQELEESVERKTKLLQHLNNASSAITDGENQQILTRETLQNESEKKMLEMQFKNVIGRLQRTHSEEIERNNQLEVHLTEANARVAQLTVQLRQQQTDFERRVKDAQDDATRRVQRLAQQQLIKQTDLETKLSEANSKVETLSQQNEAERLKLQNDLQAAQSKVEALAKEKQEVQTSLETIRSELEHLKINSDKTTQYEAQVQLAKLQTELREAKKHNESLKYQLTQGEEQLHNLQSRVEKAEASLLETQEELEGTKCMMDKYEERFIEREKDMETLQEEKEFAGRELEFARSEIQKLKVQLSRKDAALALSHKEREEEKRQVKEETQRLGENFAMARKELADQKQTSYDKERDLQAQLTQRIAEFSNLQKEMSIVKQESSEREKSLQIALDKRGADLAALNDEIDNRVEGMRQELQEKDNQISELQGKLSSVEEEQNLISSKKKELEKEVQELKDLANETYFEKCRITKDLQAVKVELSETKIQHAKIQDTHLQRAKQMDSKAKVAQNALKEKEVELATTLEKLERANTKTTTLSENIEQLEVTIESSSATAKALEEERDQLARREYQLQKDVEEKEREKQTYLEASRDAKSHLLDATNKVSCLERHVAELESSKHAADQEISSLTDEKRDLAARVELLRNEVENKESELSAKSIELMSSKTTVENLREEVMQRQEEAEASQKSLIAAQSQYTQLYERFTNASEESSEKLQALTSDLIKAQDELAENQNTCSKLERQIGSLKSQVTESEEKVRLLRSELADEKQKGSELASLNNLAKEQFESRTEDMNAEINTHRQQISKLEQECCEKSQLNGNLNTEISTLEKKLASSRALFGSEQNKYQKERKELEELLMSQRRQSAELTEQLSIAKATLKEANGKLSDTEIGYEDRLTWLNNDLAAKEEKLANLQHRKDEMERELADCREELSVTKVDLERVEESRRRSREEVDHLSGMIDEMRTEHLAQIEKISSGYKDEVARLTKEKDDLETTIRKAEELREKLQIRLDDTEKNLNDERDRREELVMEQELLTSSLHRAEDLVAELRCELQVLREEQANESFDSVDSDTLAMSKRELRVKCKYLAEEIQEAETRATEAKSGVAQRTQHIRSLEGDMAEMSAELERMIQTSEQLERALVKARSDKASSDAIADELRHSIELHQEKTQALKNELDVQYNENSGLLEKIREYQQEKKAAKEREGTLRQELELASEALKVVEAKQEEAKQEIEAKIQELASLKEKGEASETRISDLEFQIAKLEDDLSVAEKENARVLADSKHTEERLKEQLREYSNDYAKERAVSANLQGEIDDLKLALSNKESAEAGILDKLEKERAYGSKMAKLREEAVTELAEASRVLAAQKGIIKVQEARAADAESRAKKLTEQVTGLQESIQDLEAKSAESGNLTQTQAEEMEKKRMQLEHARQNAKAEAETLRVEVRQANRKAAELERVNKSLQTRIEELKNTAESTKAQLREARNAWSESDSLSRSLENDLQSSRAEIDHLRAKLQLCGATIARLKSDRILLQEQAAQTGSDPNSNGVLQELSKLRSELHTKTSQLSSTAASLRNYKKTIKEMKQSEEQLVLFIDEIIQKADATFVQLSKLSSELQNCDVAVESASKGTPQKIMDASCCFGQFLSLVQQASAELEGKKQKLESWKVQHSHLASTPSAKSNGSSNALLSPNDASVSRYFGKLKEALGQARDSFDGSQVENVILALEGQIDGLCSDLKNAQIALKEKDKLFAELEYSRKLSSIQETDEQEHPVEVPSEKPKRAAVRMMAKAIENQASRDLNGALRKWSCEVAFQRSSENQKHNATAIQYQLEETRKKLIMLKTHFKRKGNEKCLEILSD